MAKRTTTPKIKINEKDAQKALLDYLYRRMQQGKLMFWRNNNAPVFDITRKVYRKLPKYTLKGSPDIIVIMNGDFIGLEVKGSGIKLSEDQVKFQKLVREKGGGEYHRVTTIDDLITLGL